MRTSPGWPELYIAEAFAVHSRPPSIEGHRRSPLWVLWDYAKTIPNEIDESAAIDGAGPLAIFFRIYLPLITPTLIAVGTYAFFFAWNEYLYAVLLLQGEKMITLPVGMGNFLTSDDSPWNLLMALSVIYSIPPVILYYIFRRYLTHGLVSGAVQGT